MYAGSTWQPRRCRFARFGVSLAELGGRSIDRHILISAIFLNVKMVFKYRKENQP